MQRLAVSADPVHVIEQAVGAGLTTVAAHRGPLSQPAPYRAGLADGWLLVVGNEDRGVAPVVIDACQYRWYLPMANGTDSLNVATAAAVMIDRLNFLS